MIYYDLKHLPAIALKHDLFNHINAFISDITILLYTCPEAGLVVFLSHPL